MSDAPSDLSPAKPAPSPQCDETPSKVAENHDAPAANRQGAPPGPDSVSADEIDGPFDPEWAETIKKLAKETMDVRWHHSPHFSQDEDKIIAAGLASNTPLYKIAQTIRCHRITLVKHIEATPMLALLRSEQDGRRRDVIQEGIDSLLQIAHPGAVLWAAERLMPDVYGKDRDKGEEDDTRLIIGPIPDEDIEEGDRILSEAASKPPEVGLAALANPAATTSAQPEQSPAAASAPDLPAAPPSGSLPAAALGQPAPISQPAPAPAPALAPQPMLTIPSSFVGGYGVGGYGIDSFGGDFL